MEWYGKDVASGEHFVCEWVQNPETKSYPRKTVGGKTGYVRICGRSGGEAVPDVNVKVHCCADEPCTADWSHTQYGREVPPGFHFRPTQWRPQAAPLAEGRHAGATALVGSETREGLPCHTGSVSYTHLTLPTKRIV